MTATPSGYWAPFGGGPLLGAAPGDDTDVRLLAKSIETAHARCWTTASSDTTTTGGFSNLAFPAITQSEPGAFTRAAGVGSTGNKLSVATGFDGLYRVTLVVQGPFGDLSPTGSAQVTFGGGPTQTIKLDTAAALTSNAQPCVFLGPISGTGSARDILFGTEATVGRVRVITVLAERVGP